jgi:phosphoribosyl 1,2-cyclic phosphate phosphodiesterase
LEAVLFTHEHKDHIAGLDDVRAFNYIQKQPTDIYASENVIKALKREFYYAFEENAYPGVPRLNVHPIENNPFYVDDVLITPVLAYHYKLPVFGFRVGDFAYITDANRIPEKEMEKIKNVKVLVLNALRKQKHISHFTLSEAIETARKLNAQTTYFTHISHLMGKHEEVSKELPENMYLAYDGLTVEV